MADTDEYYGRVLLRRLEESLVHRTTKEYAITLMLSAYSDLMSVMGKPQDTIASFAPKETTDGQ